MVLTGLTCFLDISRSIYIFVCDGGRGKIKQIRRSVITVLGRRRKGTGVRKYSVWCQKELERISEPELEPFVGH